MNVPVCLLKGDARVATTESGGKKAAARRRNRPSPRQRLLDAATKLFNEEGIRVIGIDRILREADVAKASLYSLLGSKDNLVVAYLEKMDEEFRVRWQERADAAADIDGKVLAFFDIAIDEEPGKNFRGSPFFNAATEYPRPETESEQRIVEAARDHRRWMLSALTRLLTEKNGYDSSDQAHELLIYLDGGLAGARFTQTVAPLETARQLAKNELGAPPADYSI